MPHVHVLSTNLHPREQNSAERENVVITGACMSISDMSLHNLKTEELDMVTRGGGGGGGGGRIVD